MTSLKEIPGLDNAKLEKAVAIRKAYDENQISLEEAQRQLKSEIQSLKPWEIAQIEQNISPEEGDEACGAEDCPGKIMAWRRRDFPGVLGKGAGIIFRNSKSR